MIFDGECGFCTRSRDLLKRLDHSDQIDMVPFQAPGVPERFGISIDELSGSVWWVDGDTRCSGADAVNAALSTLLHTDAPSRIYRLPGVRQAQDAAYRWVTANRHRLPGTTPWCHTHPEDCS